MLPGVFCVSCWPVLTLLLRPYDPVSFFFLTMWSPEEMRRVLLVPCGTSSCCLLASLRLGPFQRPWPLLGVRLGFSSHPGALKRGARPPRQAPVGEVRCSFLISGFHTVTRSRCGARWWLWDPRAGVWVPKLMAWFLRQGVAGFRCVPWVSSLWYSGAGSRS